MSFVMQKTETPLKANPIKPEIITLKIPLLFFHPSGNFGKVNLPHSLIYDGLLHCVL